MEILIVEDDENIANAASEILSLKSYDTEICDSGTLAVELIKQKNYDLILLDVMLPGLNGFQVLEKISYRQIPVIFITAKQDIRDKLCGFELGAEDYIVKPFEMMELLARVEVVLRRNKKVQEEYEYGDLCLNIAHHTITKNGKEIDLTPKEFELAAYFIRNQELILNRDVLLNTLWGGEFPGETRTVDNHVRMLRKKLDWKGYLVTVPKMGYKLKRID